MIKVYEERILIISEQERMEEVVRVVIEQATDDVRVAIFHEDKCIKISAATDKKNLYEVKLLKGSKRRGKK